MALARILVDGYSLLHNWPELAAGQPRHSERARDELIHVLTRYHDATGEPVTVFFDGAGAPANAPANGPDTTVEVLFSRAGQTADQMIERAAHRFQNYGDVLVVTDDHAERDTVTSMGAATASCMNFIGMIEKALTELRDELRSHNRLEQARFNRSRENKTTKKRELPNHSAWPLRIIPVLLAGMVWTSTAPAQPATGWISSRYLLVFDTSSAMRKCLPATQATVDKLFFSMMNSQLQDGDTIGVWTFNRKLYAGRFPLQRWLPENAATIASNITTFIQQEHYSGSPRFDAIMPSLNRIILDSDRLTVLIFCDGDGKIQGTPFDDSINAVFKKNRRDLGKARQIFIVVLRTQLGQYIGYTVNSSIMGVDFPEFPPWPQPPQPIEPPKTNQPPAIQAKTNQPPPPAIRLPPLVIVGTNVSTNLLPPEAFSKPMPSNPPPTNPSTATTVSNSSPSFKTSSPTNIIRTNPAPPTIQETRTNAAATLKENSRTDGSNASNIAAVFLVAAGVLAIFLMRRLRQARHGSFITRSMKKD